MLLEVCIKSKHLPIVLDPWWLNPWNGVVLWSWSVLHEGHGVDAFGHFVDQIGVDGLSHILPFFLLTVSVIRELLSLVEGLLIRVAEDVAREERNLLRNVGPHDECLFGLVG